MGKNTYTHIYTYIDKSKKTSTVPSPIKLSLGGKGQNRNHRQISKVNVKSVYSQNENDILITII